MAELENDLCSACNGTGLKDNLTLCPVCGGTPSATARKQLEATPGDPLDEDTEPEVEKEAEAEDTKPSK